jgi:hypothetical protein
MVPPGMVLAAVVVGAAVIREDNDMDIDMLVRDTAILFGFMLERNVDIF